MEANNSAIAIKFVEWDVPELESLKNSKVYELKEKVIANEPLSREEKDWITDKANNNSYFKKGIPLSGYYFNFSDVLKTYIVKQYGSYQEYTAIDKTSLRAMLIGKIDKIIEVNE